MMQIVQHVVESIFFFLFRDLEIETLGIVIINGHWRGVLVFWRCTKWWAYNVRNSIVRVILCRSIPYKKLTRGIKEWHNAGTSYMQIPQHVVGRHCFLLFNDLEIGTLGHWEIVIIDRRWRRLCGFLMVYKVVGLWCESSIVRLCCECVDSSLLCEDPFSVSTWRIKNDIVI